MGDCRPARLRRGALVVFAVALLACPASGEGWLQRFKAPPLEDRPLQIVHGIDPSGTTPEGIGQVLNAREPDRAARGRMEYLKNRGLGGIVCNVAFKDYMRSESKWKDLVAGVKACDRLGMVVWLYDEDGYPSGAAGGLVLEENRDFEALELAFDPERKEPFILRPAYEHTHASNNYYAARRYVNLMDDRAVRCFIEKTHGVYWKRLQPYFGRTIRAFFTDEPSLIAINIGQIPEDVRKRVRVVDPIDPEARPLPCVPWCYDLPERYKERWGEDILPRRRSLFEGNTPADREVRRRFWSLVADLVARRYFGAIESWCARHQVASSGHSLWEEGPMRQVALEGNAVKVLARMDIPGMDMLSSDPEAVIHTGWLTAALPSSAALLESRRRVMTEVSDFSQKMGGQGPAGVAEMQATAAWQAAWGVTEFTLYYGLADRSAEDLRAYCDFVGRLNAILKPARRDPKVLLYYPVCDLWAEYLPVAPPFSRASQSARAQRIVKSFLDLGRKLQRSQVPFALIDHEHLAAAKVFDGGKLAAGAGTFEVVILPASSEPPPEAARVLEVFRRGGGRVITAREGQAAQLEVPGAGRWKISPPSERICLGAFRREGRRIALVVNLGKEAYEGRFTLPERGRWMLLDPRSGETAAAAGGAGTREIPLALEARRAILVIEAPPGEFNERRGASPGD